MINPDVLEFLFSGVATIVATLTGLIGAFSTFRLQNISAEIGFLKGLVLEKKPDSKKTLNEYIKGEDYHLLEKIYDRNLEGVSILENVIAKHNLHQQLNEFSFDLQNIRNNQLQYNSIKSLTLKSFSLLLIFVMISLVFFLFTNTILAFPFFSIFITGYFFFIGLTFYQFKQQVKLLIKIFDKFHLPISSMPKFSWTLVKGRTYSRVSKGDCTPCSSQNRT